MLDGRRLSVPVAGIAGPASEKVVRGEGMPISKVRSQASRGVRHETRAVGLQNEQWDALNCGTAALFSVFCQGDLTCIDGACCLLFQFCNIVHDATLHCKILNRNPEQARRVLPFALVTLTGACVAGARQQRRPEDPFRHCVSPRADRRAEGPAAAGIAARLSWRLCPVQCCS